MILLLSLSKDFSTSNVIDCLMYRNTIFVRINEKEITDIEIEISNENLYLKLVEDINCELSNLTEYWHRRINFNITGRSLSGQNKINS